MGYDQPDWQLFQSTVQPYVYQEVSSAPVGLQNYYIGPYRALFVNAFDSGNGEVWDMFLTFANDAARTQIVQQQAIILSTAVAFIGFVPVLAPYLTIGVSATVPAPGQNFHASVTPTLLDPPTLGRYLPRPLISVVGQTLNHNNFTDLFSLYITTGPARLTLRSTGYNVQYDLQAMASNGAWSSIARYWLPERNVAKQFDVTLPYQPVRLEVSNFEGFEQITFDARLEPI